MADRTIYEGGIQVSGDDYTHYVPDADDEREIEGLDEIVSRRPIVGFTLDYPFDRPYDGRVVGDAGITLRQIIDAIRGGFRVMYRGATEEEIPNLDNKHVTGDYGEAFHEIGDLAIERIDLVEDGARLDVFIGS